jgi:hypothetical protein
MADLLMKMPLPYEPKRENRFILRFPSSMGINEWFVETASRHEEVHVVIPQDLSLAASIIEV